MAGEDLFLETFSEAKVHDPRLIGLRQKVSILRHPDWDGPSMGSDNPVKIRMKDGREYTTDDRLPVQIGKLEFQMRKRKPMAALIA